jgi:hypothetical protein
LSPPCSCAKKNNCAGSGGKLNKLGKKGYCKKGYEKMEGMGEGHGNDLLNDKVIHSFMFPPFSAAGDPYNGMEGDSLMTVFFATSVLPLPPAPSGNCPLRDF